MRRIFWTIGIVMALSLGACGGGDSPVTDEGTDTIQPDVPVDGVSTDPGTDLGEDRPGTDQAEDPGVDPGEDPGTDPGTEPGGDEGTDLGQDTILPDNPPTDTGNDVPPTDVVVPCKEGDPCEDGNPCTFGEACDAEGKCAGGTVYTCDDKRDCTDDTCDGLGDCQYTLQADKCLIAGVCHAKGDVNPLNACQACKPGKDKATKTGWSVAAEGDPCDPTAGLGKCDEALSGSCKSGLCVADVLVAKGCDDSNPCTQDSCDTTYGCVNQPVSGAACNLGDACKPGSCNQGHCIIPQDVSCDDGNPCTEDSCDPAVGCIHTSLNLVPCDDGSACTVEDACTDGACKGIPANCDDGNVCTIDGCDGITGCWHDVASNPCCDGGVSRCDDGNPCTNDDCDPVTMACINTPNTAACNDHEPCTVNDSCNQGECTGIHKNCEDGNPCTQDACGGGGICTHVPQSGVACDDGIDCSTNDHCESGRCVSDLSTCKCTVGFSPAVSKFVTMSSSAEGKPGTGLDLDQNPNTCAPPDPPCSGGIDNALGPILGMSMVQDALAKAMSEGKVMILLEHRGLKTDGTKYTVGVFIGKLDPSNETCDFQTQDCGYIVDRATVNTNADQSPCPPTVFIDNAQIVGNKFTAGGRGYKFPFDLPLFGGISLHVDLYLARIEGTVAVSGSKVMAMSGILGGALPKQQLMDAITAIPDEEWAKANIPIDKGTAMALLDALVTPDIDGDGDGQLESASLALKFSAIAGHITGTY